METLNKEELLEINGGKKSFKGEIKGYIIGEIIDKVVEYAPKIIKKALTTPMSDNARNTPYVKYRGKIW